MHLAAEKNSLDVAELLTRSGADVKIKNNVRNIAVLVSDLIPL